MSTNQGVNLTKQDLQDIVQVAVSTALQEAKKPAPMTAQQEADILQAQEQRRATAESVAEQKKNARWMQMHGCSHEHQKSAGGGTHCVYVKDNDVPQSPGFILCQKCQGRFRPDEPLMRKLDPDAIFDTNTFNRLMQDCVQTGAEILG